MLPLVQMTEKTAFHGETYQGDSQRGQNQGQPETRDSSPEKYANRISQKRADHIEGAVSNVGNPEYAQHKAHAGCDDKQNGRSAQSHQELLAQTRGRDMGNDVHLANLPIQPRLVSQSYGQRLNKSELGLTQTGLEAWSPKGFSQRPQP